MERGGDGSGPSEATGLGPGRDPPASALGPAWGPESGRMRVAIAPVRARAAQQPARAPFGGSPAEPRARRGRNRALRPAGRRWPAPDRDRNHTAGRADSGAVRAGAGPAAGWQRFLVPVGRNGALPGAPIAQVQRVVAVGQAAAPPGLRPRTEPGDHPASGGERVQGAGHGPVRGAGAGSGRAGRPAGAAIFGAMVQGMAHRRRCRPADPAGLARLSVSPSKPPPSVFSGWTRRASRGKPVYGS